MISKGCPSQWSRQEVKGISDPVRMILRKESEESVVDSSLERPSLNSSFVSVLLSSIEQLFRPPQAEQKCWCHSLSRPSCPFRLCIAWYSVCLSCSIMARAGQWSWGQDLWEVSGNYVCQAVDTGTDSLLVIFLTNDGKLQSVVFVTSICVCLLVLTQRLWGFGLYHLCPPPLLPLVC